MKIKAEIDIAINKLIQIRDCTVSKCKFCKEDATELINVINKLKVILISKNSKPHKKKAV